jgi:hypothetical protein
MIQYDFIVIGSGPAGRRLVSNVRRYWSGRSCCDALSGQNRSQINLKIR